MAQSLSGRLLLLTLLYMLASEILIFVPAIGLYHRELLVDHILSSELAILPFTEPGGQSLPDSLRGVLLRHANSDAVMLKRHYRRDFFQVGMMPARIDRTIDLTSDTLLSDMINGMDCLLRGGARTLYVIAPTRIKDAQSIGIILGEAPIKAALLIYARRAIGAALFISGVTAALVFASLYFFLVRPLRRITSAMVTFHENPEDASRILSASRRADEIGLAERELAAMQRDLYGFLREKARLAALGAAVSRIQHDLRNILASAQLASDRLSTSEDPVVKRLAPRLMAAVNRAVSLASNTLNYGRTVEAPPQKTTFALRTIVDEAAQVALEQNRGIRFANRIEAGFTVEADREQLFRVILNLIGNAGEAIATRKPDGEITATATHRDGTVEIDIADDGPGVPEAIRSKLFQPFVSAARPGGSGLGLAIARDLVRGHGGELSLVSTGPEGTVFRVVIPDRS